jgi:hypothetical protein
MGLLARAAFRCSEKPPIRISAADSEEIRMT